jgi:glycosyltransferase involved in cell wall biosynthesis
MFLGVRRPYKGFDVLLEAAPRVPGATFAFVGPGPAVSGERVIDAGPVDDAERAAWLDAADLLCLPSQAEVFPVSILEAWSAGTPVLTSDIPSLRELIAASGGGLAVPANAEALAAALNDLLADPGRLARLGQAGHDRWRDTYTPSVVASRHEQLYAQLLEEEVACAA